MKTNEQIAREACDAIGSKHWHGLLLAALDEVRDAERARCIEWAKAFRRDDGTAQQIELAIEKGQ